MSLKKDSMLENDMSGMVPAELTILSQKATQN